MKLVIDIPEEVREHIIDIANDGNEIPLGINAHMIKAIANGEVLEPCDDVVSRDQVLNAIIDFVTFEEYIDNSNHVTFIPLERRINTMSPVTPSNKGWEEMTVPCEACGHDMTFKIAVCGEPSRKGHWIEVEDIKTAIIDAPCCECEVMDGETFTCMCMTKHDVLAIIDKHTKGDTE